MKSATGKGSHHSVYRSLPGDLWVAKDPNLHNMDSEDSEDSTDAQADPSLH